MKKLTYEYVKDFIESYNYKLLETDYKNSMNLLTLQCDNGHIYKQKFKIFKKGCRCNICSNNQRLSFSYVKSYVENENYSLVSTEYENNRKKMDIKCSNGHIFKMAFTNFQRGERCPVCFGTHKHNIEYVKSYVENENYSLVSTEYENNKEKISIKCNKNHIFEMRFNCFQQGERCPICNIQKTKSKQEKEIVEYIRTIYKGTIDENNRRIIKNPITNNFLELDIYMPDLGKAIEFNSKYWHSDIDTIYRDNQKILQCKEKDIKLLVIWYEQWQENREHCLDNVHKFILDK